MAETQTQRSERIPQNSSQNTSHHLERERTSDTSFLRYIDGQATAGSSKDTQSESPGPYKLHSSCSCSEDQFE